MKEEDAKKKICKSLLAACISSGMTAEDDNEMLYKCKGSECMMWEADIVAEDIEIEIEPEDCVKKSELKAGHEYSFIAKLSKTPKQSGLVVVKLRKYVDGDSGDCGLKSKELHCEGCNN